jgi:hypothetical protein
MSPDSVGFLLELPLNPEYGGGMFLRILGFSPNYTAMYNTVNFITTAVENLNSDMSF